VLSGGIASGDIIFAGSQVISCGGIVSGTGSGAAWWCSRPVVVTSGRIALAPEVS
jgi:hypothetical protein